MGTFDTESTVKQDVRLLLHQKKMKVVLFLTLALVASALALPLCTGPECGSMEEVESPANNMTTIIIKLGNDTDFKMTPDHLSNWKQGGSSWLENQQLTVRGLVGSSPKLV